MSKIEFGLLKKKFRGSMLGTLIGDCLGGPYEGEKLTSGMRLVLQKSLDKLEGPIYKAPVMQYTDDSVMTKSLAESLIEKRDLDLVDVAKRFVKSYYQEPERGYGNAVVTVFEKLRGNKFVDVLSPAKDQFNGTGSFGNGAAMRVAPVALFCYQNYKKLLDFARKQSLLTHAHKIGIDGAILQAITIHQSLLTDPDVEIDVIEFVDQLISKMNNIEKDEEGLGLDEAQPYKLKLNTIKKLLTANEESLTHGHIIRELGNEVSALRSVPTAIYCFLRAQKPIEGIETVNPLRRAVQYAISLGGDSDTIGSMTGAIAGARYGDEKISSNVLHHCEGSAEFFTLGDHIYKITAENK